MNNINISEIKSISNHQDKVWSIIWHPIEDIIASSGSDKRIMIWNLNGDCLAILDECHSRTIRSVAWDFSGNFLAAASFDSTITVWKKKFKENLGFECIASLEGHENEVKSVSFSVSGLYLASCSRDKSIWIWDFDEEGDFSCNNVLQGHTQDVKMVKWSPLEDVLFSCSYDDSIKVWKFEESQDDWICANTLKGHSSTVWGIEISKTGKIFYTCSDDKSIIIWKINDNTYKNITLVNKISHAHERAILSISINYEETLLLTGSSDNTIGLWNIIKNSDDCDLKLLLKKEIHDEDINCVTFGKSLISKNLIASCSDDGLIKLLTIV